MVDEFVFKVYLNNTSIPSRQWNGDIEQEIYTKRKEFASMVSKCLPFRQDCHYENMPIQTYCKFFHQIMKIFR